jgi:hypothetical protein
MSILSALKRQTDSIDDLAKLPQAMIMQMAQKGQIREDMLAPILSRKAEMADAVARMQALQGGNQARPSVLEQVMATNAMAEQPQIDNTGVSQLPIPERQYAGGGIIAFSRGSLVDYDDDEIDPYDDYARAAAAVQRSNAMPVAKSSILPKSYEAALAEKGQTPASIRKMMIDATKKGDDVMPPVNASKRGGHKYEDMVIQEAQRLGVDPNLALHVLYKETGNLKNPETAKSSAGALGVMQLMPKTAKGLGVDPLNPEENIRGGVTYLKQMYDRYQDPTLALAAYNAGPGRLDKVLRSGQGMSGLPRETQNYIVANRMASGGEVKHFYNGGTMGGFELDNYPSDESMMSPEYQQYFKLYQNELAKKMKSKKDIPPSLQVPSVKAAPIETKKIPDVVPVVDNKLPPVVQEKAPEVVPKTPMELFLEQNAADRQSLVKQRSEDRNMALLAAGLGIMGGTSPYALANIGQGGLSGVSYLSGTNKDRAAQQAALDKSRITAMHYGNIGDYYKSGIQSKEDKMAQQTYDRAVLGIRELEKNIEAAAARNVSQLKGINEAINPAEMQALMERERARLRALADPQFRSLYKRADIEMPTFSTAPVDTTGWGKVKEKGK